MGLKEQLSIDLKDAMRNKDSVKRTLLRTLMAEVRNAEIDKKSELDDAGIIGVLSKQSQQRRIVQKHSERQEDRIWLMWNWRKSR